MSTETLNLKASVKSSQRVSIGTHQISDLLSRFLHTGIYDDTSPILADRIVYSNWLCIIASVINLLALLGNCLNGYSFFAFWNLVYEAGIIVCFVLNKKRSYLAGRLAMLIPAYTGILICSAVQGTVVQMEHFLLSFAALAFTLFHPSERRWAWFFGTISGVGYLVLVNRTEPLFPIAGVIGPHTALDLRINQVFYLIEYIPCLVALSNAYARATRLADRQRAELYEANKMASLGQMAGGIAHEIINPLAIIDALTERLNILAKLKEVNREAVLNTAEMLQKTSHRIVSIVRGLQILSRDGKKQPFERISIHQVVEDTLSFCQERFKMLGIELTLTRPPKDIVLDCRVVQVSQALLNLLINACDAVQAQPGGKWVQVNIQDQNNEIAISVRNSGEKIPKHVQEKLFQPFFTTKDVGRGTGLGLSISLAMMKENGGSIRLDPNDSHTHFIITLPKVRGR